jgi:hypothetical protein
MWDGYFLIRVWCAEVLLSKSFLREAERGSDVICRRESIKIVAYVT